MKIHYKNSYDSLTCSLVCNWIEKDLHLIVILLIMIRMHKLENGQKKDFTAKQFIKLHTNESTIFCVLVNFKSMKCYIQIEITS